MLAPASWKGKEMTKEITELSQPLTDIDGEFSIQQWRENGHYVLGLYRKGMLVFVAPQDRKLTYGELSKALADYIKIYG